MKIYNDAKDEHVKVHMFYWSVADALDNDTVFAYEEEILEHVVYLSDHNITVLENIVLVDVSDVSGDGLYYPCSKHMRDGYVLMVFMVEVSGEFKRCIVKFPLTHTDSDDGDISDN